MGEVIDAVAEGVAFDFLVDGEGATFVIVVELHLGGVIAGLTIDEIADSGVFDNHFGPEGISGETEKIGAVVGENLNDNISPAGEDVGGLLNLVVWQSGSNDLI